MSYNLTHTGLEVDMAIDKVLDITPSAEEINEAVKSIGNKVDKEDGKGLISDEERTKLDNIAKADWNDNDPFSWAYIKNRTHSFLPWEEAVTIDISGDTLGSLISPVSHFFSVNGIAHSSEEVNGQEFEVQDSTGYDRFDVVFQGESAYLRHTWHGGTDRTISVCPSGKVTPLTSAYIPKEIARNKDVDNKVDESLESKANKDGRYSKLTSGFAENIVGDGSTTEEMFSLRPTAGEDRNVANTTYIDGERNEAARITAIKGNSVVWNSRAATIEEIAYYRRNFLNYEATTNTFTVKVDGAAADRVLDATVGKSRPEVGHKYFVAIDGEYDNNAVVHFGSQSYSQKIAPSSPQVVECVKKGYFYFYVFGASNTTITAGTTFVINNVLLCDLTKMFGSGNEPTTAEEFYQRIAIGIDINAYNNGTIINGNYKTLRSTAFNQFNGTYARVCAGVRYHITGDIASIGFTPEENGTTEDITLADSKYTPSQNGYIYATGNNICIHICWEEYAHLEDMFEPYKPFERDLSWIKRYFPEGMRSAGSARDEIRYNAAEQRWEAVQRVGVVDLGSLYWFYGNTENTDIKTMVSDSLGKITKGAERNNAEGNILCSHYTTDAIDNVYLLKADKTIGLSTTGRLRVYDSEYTTTSSVSAFTAAMQGIMLHYELAEPIITPIAKEINLDYDCADYGTEELVSDGASAPLVADIVYAPNALATLKQVPDILRRLAALEAKSVTNVNIEE